MLVIAGVSVRNPSEIAIGRFDLTNAARTASGKMAMEIIASKTRVDCAWKMLPDEDLQAILDAISANKPFFSLQYPDAGGQQTITCYCGDITTSLWHTIGGIRYWKEVAIAFIEQ